MFVQFCFMRDTEDFEFLVCLSAGIMRLYDGKKGIKYLNDNAHCLIVHYLVKVIDCRT